MEGDFSQSIYETKEHYDSHSLDRPSSPFFIPLQLEDHIVQSRQILSTVLGASGLHKILGAPYVSRTAHHGFTGSLYLIRFKYPRIRPTRLDLDYGSVITCWQLNPHISTMI